MTEFKLYSDTLVNIAQMTVFFVCEEFLTYSALSDVTKADLVSKRHKGKIKNMHFLFLTLETTSLIDAENFLCGLF